jgi:hypothetical protein
MNDHFRTKMAGIPSLLMAGVGNLHSTDIHETKMCMSILLAVFADAINCAGIILRQASNVTGEVVTCTMYRSLGIVFTSKSELLQSAFALACRQESVRAEHQAGVEELFRYVVALPGLSEVDVKGECEAILEAMLLDLCMDTESDDGGDSDSDADNAEDCRSDASNSFDMGVDDHVDTCNTSNGDTCEGQESSASEYSEWEHEYANSGGNWDVHTTPALNDDDGANGDAGSELSYALEDYTSTEIIAHSEVDVSKTCVSTMRLLRYQPFLQRWSDTFHKSIKERIALQACAAMMIAAEIEFRFGALPPCPVVAQAVLRTRTALWEAETRLPALWPASDVGATPC